MTRAPDLLRSGPRGSGGPAGRTPAVGSGRARAVLRGR
ncbi:hypothetical protein FM106_23835 [Brachybacterium faecium]|nr:hypothetical protein FM106_23835 [Brachybacterium faecium]